MHALKILKVIRSELSLQFSVWVGGGRCLGMKGRSTMQRVMKIRVPSAETPYDHLALPTS